MAPSDTLLTFLCGAWALRNSLSSAMMLAFSATRNDIYSPMLCHLQSESCVVTFRLLIRKAFERTLITLTSSW